MPALSSLNLGHFVPREGPSTSEEVAKELLCYCTDRTHDCVNETCSLKYGGQCFHFVKSVVVGGDDIETHHSYGCLFREDDNSQLQCHAQLTSTKFVIPQNISCCRDEDYCNYYLEAELNIPPPSQNQNLTPLVWVVCCLGVMVFMLVCFALCQYYRRRFSNKQKWKKKKSLQRPLLGTLGGAKKDELLDGSLSWDFSLTQEQNYHNSPPDISSGSGSGVPTLIQTTIGRQLEFSKSIGKGRYGEVWVAKWAGEEVAVKVFFTTEEASWENEKDIYQTVMLRHHNVLGFIAADIRGHQSVTEMLLVTDYHPCGSLYDYLKREPPISPQAALLLASSVVKGLAHLHVEYRGTQEKSAIAHRDIKSKNVLVKMDGECAIADFGLAVRKDRDSGEAVVRRNNRVGTKRYMAPEVLNNTLNSRDFNGYTQADMYALGLVLWEISRRIEESPPEKDVSVAHSPSEGVLGATADRQTPPLALGGQSRMPTISDDSGVSNGTDGSFVSVSRRRAASFSHLATVSSSGEEFSGGSALSGGMKAAAVEITPIAPPKRPKSRAAMPYLCPYGDMVPNDPSFDQMRKIVCVDNLRPGLDEQWFNSEHLKQYVRIIKECWREMPGARLTAMRVKINLMRLYTTEMEHKAAFRV